MTQVNNDLTINLSPSLCDYCHQRPKFPPYDYCGRTCGARATAVGNRVAAPPVVCKQCNQRPVHQNYQFCGRNCANTWAAVHRQINTGSSTVPWPPSWNLNQQTIQRGGQPGQKQGGIKALFNGLKSFVSPTNQTQQQQQQQTAATPVQTQHASQNTTNSASTFTTASPIAVLPSAISDQLSPGTFQHPPNLPFPANGGTPNQDDIKRLGPFNGVYPISPPPVYSASGSSVPQIANSTDPDPSQTTPNPVSNVMSLPSYSAGNLGHTSEPDDSNTDTPPGSDPDQEPSENGDGEDGDGEVVMGDMDVQSVESFVCPPSASTSETIGTCKLEGCSNPTFVDPITDLESEYCSWKHQGEAMVFEQPALCILCRKMPRGSKDHFCSMGCRARALFP